MRYMLSDIPFAWHSKYTFSIDHQLPVSRLATMIERDHQPGWPISAVGNLALLPVGINSAKSAMTTMEYLDSLSPEERDVETPILEYAACKGFDVSLLNIPQKGGEDRMERGDYVDLIEKRQVVGERVIDSLGL